MKYTHTCPKCSSKTISKIEGGAFKGNMYNTLSYGITTIYLTRYVCTSCGFTENYIDDKKDLVKIEKKFGSLSDDDYDFV